MNRRAFLLAPLLFATKAEAASVHLNGILTATDSGNLEGYYALCSESGKCDAIDTIGISTHPKGLFADDLRELAGRKVQVSVFPI